MRTIVLLLLFASWLPAAKNLEVYFIDVEGGHAALYVAPSGESMLVDAGWGGFNNRDADRIAATAKRAGVKRIDYLVSTHYHSDHIGGVPQLAAKLPIRNFVDHGENVEKTKGVESLFESYAEVRAKGRHIVAKAGDVIPMKGLDVQVLTSAGRMIETPIKGAGAANPACAGFEARPEDTTENAQSVGTMVTFGSFRIINLGDLTWNKEYELMCPNSRTGTVDVFVVSHHGMNMSGSRPLVHGLGSRVAIMTNGARKGGSPEVLKMIRSAPGLEDLWQLHYAISAGKENNTPDTFIANTLEQCDGEWIKLSVQPDGAFTVTNSRNKYSKTYPSSSR